jgi:hypothetical protein
MERITMKSRLFDVNVYVVDGMVNVIFYKLIYADALNGKIVGADTSDQGEAGRVSLNIHATDPDTVEAIRYALDSDSYDDRPLNDWEEYDAWNTSEWFMQGDSPKIFRDFTNGLESYEPTLGHLWEFVPGTASHSWSLDALRRCSCGAEYRVERVGF